MANSIRLSRLLEAHDWAGLQELFHAFFASIPYEWHTSNDIVNYEGYYASAGWTWRCAPAGTCTCSSSGGGDGAAGIGPRPVAGAGLRGEVPGAGRADPPDRRGVQPPDAQRHRLRGRRRLTDSCGQQRRIA